MSKAKGIGPLRAALRPRSTPTPIVLPYSHRQLIHDPNEPGCSRWFSSTPTQPTLNRRSFFSANPQSTISHSSPSTSTLPELETPLPPNISTPHISKTSHLPLPPSLPYSPNSHPFRRHLEILSLSLYSTADESWSVYLALHSSLRQCIPDGTFVSLLAHQLDHPNQRQAWSRVKALLRLAKRCQMDLADVGLENIFKSLRLGMRRSRAEDDPSKSEETDKVVRALWRAMGAKVADFRQVPLAVRTHWLGLQYRRLAHLQRRFRASHRSACLAVEEATVELVRRGGAEGLGHMVAQVLSRSRGSTVDGLRHGLRMIAWTLTQRVEINRHDIHRLMRELGSRWTEMGEDGMELVRKEIPLIVDELAIEPISTTAQQLYAALDTATSSARTRVQKALDLLESDKLKPRGIVARGISVSLSARETGSIGALGAAVDLFEAALRHGEASYEALISAITIALHKTHRSTPSPEVDKIILRFVRLLHESQLTSRLPSESIIPIVNLVLSVTPSTQSYILSRKVYQYARSASPSFQWSQHNLVLWRRLFKHALTPPNLNLHFASRLYTDLMADDVPIRRTDALMMIRSIGMRPSPSRPILLERHIKDYLWHQYGSPSPLILAVVQGLTQGGTRDAALALALAERLAEDKPLQPVVVQLIIAQLAKSSGKQDRIKCFRLLRRMGPGPESVRNFNTVLSYLVSSSTSSTIDANDKVRPGRLDRFQTLGHAIVLYGEMISLGITPNARTMSTMLRALLDAGYVDSAYAIFNECVKQRLLLKSSAVGRLMVRLALGGEMGKADIVEERWREMASFPTGRAWDRGVVGARVLVDLKRGKEVDLERVTRETGWKGNESFLRFLDTLRPPKSGSGLATSTEEEAFHADFSEALPHLSESAGARPDDKNSPEDDSTPSTSSSSNSFWQTGDRPRDEKNRVDMCSSGPRWDMVVSF